MAYIFRVSLKRTKNPIVWRKIKVNETISFRDLHFVIQTAFGWMNSHLYQFTPRGGWNSYPELNEEYADSETPYDKPGTWPFGRRYDSSLIRLNQYFKDGNKSVVYTYDFGDDWEHKVELVEVTKETIMHPVCQSGKGKCPPEDCGGTWGYYRMINESNNPDDPEYESTRIWLGLRKGESWDMNAFDLKMVNNRLMRR